MPVEFTIDWMLSPLSTTQLLESSIHRQARLISRQDHTYFQDLFTIEGLFSALGSGAFDVEATGLINNGRRVPSDGCGFGGKIDRERVNDHISAGNTFYVNGVETKFWSLMQLCMSAEKALCSTCGINLYATPAGKQGFQPHFDVQDVFILQVSGSKRWRLYGTPHPFPLRGQSYSVDQPNPDDRHLDTVLRQGDVLFIPRGMIHEAQAAEEMSVHLTLGSFPICWSDLFKSIIADAAIKSGSFRKGLPVSAMLAGDTDEIRAAVEHCFKLVLDEIDLSGALGAVMTPVRQRKYPSLRKEK